MEKHGKGKTRDEESGRKRGGDAGGGGWGKVAKEKETGKEQGKKGRDVAEKRRGKSGGCGVWRIGNGA